MVGLRSDEEGARLATDEAEVASDSPAFNAADPVQVKAKEDTAKLDEVDQDEFLRDVVMGTRNGRAWMTDLLAYCGPHRTPFSPDPYLTAHNAGIQNVGLKLLADITRVAPNSYLKLLKENK